MTGKVCILLQFNSKQKYTKRLLAFMSDESDTDIMASLIHCYG